MIVRNSWLLRKGFTAVNLPGVLVVRPGVELTPQLLNHERIHTAQMRELLYVGFYVLYVAEWLVRLLHRGNAYRNISFEREAYANQHDLTYLSRRKHYSWRHYVRGHVQGAVHRSDATGNN